MNRSFTRRQRLAFTNANREAWDEAAPVHEKANQARLLANFSKPGYSTLADHCLDRLMEIGFQGKSVAQLCCNNGRELLSLKNLGAGHCVGFDASAAFIEQAHALARASGHTDVEFVTTDIYEIPAGKTGPYALVMTTIGVLGWMPDLEGFFRVLAELTQPGGHLFIEETHPVLMMYEEGEGNAPSYLDFSYFTEDPYVETTGLDYYQGTKYKSKPMYSFQHTLSEIMMTAINAGFTLRHFAELDYDISGFCADLEHVKAKPPMGMTMVWQKTE
jgi:2-polyprenyl-3-methyl-5-hydroxy-6-metoxy-1,4-benzoquinol methylase